VTFTPPDGKECSAYYGEGSVHGARLATRSHITRTMDTSDLQGGRSEVIAKNLTLSADQAAKFWPVYQKYQQQQDAIMDAQLKGLQTYIEGFEMLDDAGALALINTHLRRDADMAALRQRWVAEFQKILPVKQVVRLMQIDRRLSLAHQVEFASRIQLAH
jgi:hypothetical protein